MKLYSDGKFPADAEVKLLLASRLNAMVLGCCSAESLGWVGTTALHRFGTCGETGLYLLHQPS